MRASVRTTTLAFAAGLAVMTLAAPAHAQAPSPSPGISDTVDPTVAPTPASLRITARAESACGAVTFAIAGLEGEDYEVHYNLDGAGWEPVKKAPYGFQVHKGEVVKYRVVQGQDAAETGPIALFQCETPAPTVTPTPSVSPTPAVTPTAATRGVVTAKYECGAVTFTNPLGKSVLIHYGTAQTDDLEGSLHLDAGKSQTIDSTNKAFGWTAWPEGDQTQDDVGHLWLPGEDLSCDEPDDSATPAPKPGPHKNGLANTGSEGRA